MNDGKSTETDALRNATAITARLLGIATAGSPPPTWTELAARVSGQAPTLDAELDALASYLGQPRGRLMEGAQRLVDHNSELRTSRDQWRSWAFGTAGNGWASRAAAAIGHTAVLYEGDDRARELLALAVEQADQFVGEQGAHDRDADALLAIGGALDVVGTGKPWAEIGKAGVAAVEDMQASLKTARQELDRLADGLGVGPLTRRGEVAVGAALILVEEAAGRGEWAREVAAAHGKSPSEPVWDVVKRVVAEYGDVVAKYDPVETVAYVDTLRADLAKSRAECATLTEQFAGLRREWAKSRAEVESLTASLDSVRRQWDGLEQSVENWQRENRALCESAVKTAKHHEAEVADLRGRLAGAEKMAEGWKTSAFALRAAHVPREDIAANRLEAVAVPAHPFSMQTDFDAGTIHLGFALPSAGGLAIRLTRDEAVELRGWLINAAGLPSIEPQKPAQIVVKPGTWTTTLQVGTPQSPKQWSLQTDGTDLRVRYPNGMIVLVPGPRPPIEQEITVNLGAGRSVLSGAVRDPSTGVYTMTPDDLKRGASAPIGYSTAEADKAPAPAANLEPLRRAAAALIDAAAALALPKAA